MKVSVSRTPPDQIPVLISELKEFARVDHQEENEVFLTIGRAATQHFENLSQTAVMHQRVDLTVTAPSPLLGLPIGPLVAGSPVDVNADGEAVDGFHIVPGTRPILKIDCLADHSAETVWEISYMAGFAATRQDVPPDIKMAILDQACLLYDGRSPFQSKDLQHSPHLARIAAKYRGVAI